MNIDDPKFTAYALDALSPEEKEACEPGVLADADSLREAELTAAFAEKLKAAFTAETNARLSAAHWREIYAEAGVEQAPGVIPFEPEPQKRLPIWALSAAAGVMFGAVIASLAITWNDRPVLIADVPVRPAAVNHVEQPEPIFAQPRQSAPSPASVPQAVVPKKAPTVVFVPRPSVPAVVGTEPRNSSFEFTDDFVGTSDTEIAMQSVDVTEVLDVPAIPPLEPDEQPNGDDVPVVAVRSPMNVPQTRPFLPLPRSTAQAPAPVVVPKPTIAAGISQAPSSLPATPPAASVSAESAVDKKPAVFALNLPPAKKITVTIPNTNARKNDSAFASGAASSDVEQIDFEQQLNKLRLGSTLDDVNAAGFSAAVSDFVGTASGVVSLGIPFTISADSGVFVNVLLDNSGLPLWLTPGNTPVIDVSEPYTLTLKP